jgi:hypothetical protein
VFLRRVGKFFLYKKREKLGVSKSCPFEIAPFFTYLLPFSFSFFYSSSSSSGSGFDSRNLQNVAPFFKFFFCKSEHQTCFLKNYISSVAAAAVVVVGVVAGLSR